MKIKIAYQKCEENQAEKLTELLRKELEKEAVVKESKSDRNKPYYHIYLSSRNILLPQNSVEKT